MAFTTGELGRVGLRFAVESNQLDQFGDLGVDHVLGLLSYPQSEADVARHVHVAERCVVLEAESDVTVARIDIGDVVALNDDATLVGDLEPGDQLQQGGLA